MSEQKWRRTTWISFPHSQPNFLHINLSFWQLTVSMHQIGSLICNQHDSFVVRITILFLLCLVVCVYSVDCWISSVSYKWSCNFQGRRVATERWLVQKDSWCRGHLGELVKRAALYKAGMNLCRITSSKGLSKSLVPRTVRARWVHFPLRPCAIAA